VGRGREGRGKRMEREGMKRKGEDNCCWRRDIWELSPPTDMT